MHSLLSILMIIFTHTVTCNSIKLYPYMVLLNYMVLLMKAPKGTLVSMASGM